MKKPWRRSWSRSCASSLVLQLKQIRMGMDGFKCRMCHSKCYHKNIKAEGFSNKNGRSSFAARSRMMFAADHRSDVCRFATRQLPICGRASKNWRLLFATIRTLLMDTTLSWKCILCVRMHIPQAQNFVDKHRPCLIRNRVGFRFLAYLQECGPN